LVAPEPREFHAGVVDVEGARLPYRIEGHGPPCLVLGSIAYYSRCLSQALREHLELVFVDLRHFAPSDPAFDLAQISLDTYADDIERVRQALGLGDVVVIGYSVHATIALAYARRHPEHVRGVVITGAAVPFASEAEQEAAFEQRWEAEASEDRKALLVRVRAELTPELRASLSPAEYFVREYVARAPFHFYDPSYDGTWLWEGTQLNMPILERLYQAVDEFVLAPGEITAPVLIVQGRSDFGSSPALWDEHRHKLGRTTFALLEKSGHLPSLEEPEQFDHVLLTWIDGLDRRSV
jgi:proline iminopeptidase